MRACGFECHADTNAACVTLGRGLQEQALIEAAQVAEVEAELAAQARIAAKAVMAGGTLGAMGCAEVTRRACEGLASLKTPEMPEPSRKGRSRERTTKTRVVAVLT
jgi:hypothetical protein